MTTPQLHRWTSADSARMVLAVTAIDTVGLFMVWLMIGIGLSLNHISVVLFWSVFLTLSMALMEIVDPEQQPWTVLDLFKCSGAYLTLLGVFSFTLWGWA